ncbi:hypothetical protein [Sorangium sp. So ce1099]
MRSAPLHRAATGAAIADPAARCSAVLVLPGAPSDHAVSDP